MYSFDNFIVSETSRLAFSACLRVAEYPARAYNPLLLYGPSGAGKTHLLYAIANAMRSRPHAKILQLTTETFVVRLISAIRVDDMAAFRAALFESEAVLLDDLCCVNDENRTREEVLLLLESAAKTGVQVVLTSSGSRPDLRVLRTRIRAAPRGSIVHIGHRERRADETSALRLTYFP